MSDGDGGLPAVRMEEAQRIKVLTWYFFNSCDTKAITNSMTSAAVVAGVVAGVAPETGPVTIVIAAVLAITGQIIQQNADVSDVNAVLIKDHWHIVTVAPQ